MAEPGRRSSFGPVVLTGLVTSGLAALAASRSWVGSDDAPTGEPLPGTTAATEAGTTYPLASAVSLVLLAAWGVLLVTRSRVRRVFAVVALLAAVALVACVVTAAVTLPGTAAESSSELLGRTPPETGYTGWFWVAAVTSVLAVAPALLAVRGVASWPEMGSRYDAPTAGARSEAEPVGEQELWQQLDAGHDPTRAPDEDPPGATR